MFDIRQSSAKAKNPELTSKPRPKKTDNLEWLQSHLPDDPDVSVLILLGGKDTLSFRLRVAQSHARHDLTPSKWSDVIMLGKRNKTFASTPVHEISLSPGDGFGFPPAANAVQTGRIDAYADPDRYPNIAMLVVPAQQKAVESAIAAFKKHAAVIKATDLLVSWLAFAWGATSNPLVDEKGIPGAVLLEYAFAAADYDLTPGLASHISCPEAIWQAARWWHELPDGKNQRAMRGVYAADHELP